MARYVVRQDRMLYTLSVVNYSLTNADALSTIADTERSLGKSGKVTATSGARINRHFGRQLSLNGPDGSHSAIAIFFVDNIFIRWWARHPRQTPRRLRPLRFTSSSRCDLPTMTAVFGGFGGLAGFFGGSGAQSPKSAGDPVISNKTSGSNAASTAASNVPSSRRADPSHADATCTGKSAGDVVQLDTPGGPVAAICTLVARPIGPPSSP
ncbi:MAG: hypothetical protein WDM77_17210 [Steroidobacteraceae bacterium]